MSKSHDKLETASAKDARVTAKPKPTSAALAKVTPSRAASPDAQKPISKLQQLAALLLRDEGATLDHMVKATGWLPHTTRAALTGLRKKGYALSSDKVDGLRTYRAVAPR